MNQTSIRVYLSIFGEVFDPDTLTDLVGITPTGTGIKSQLSDSKRTTNKDTFWDLSVGPVNSLFLEEVNDSLLKKIKGSESIIFQYMTEHNLLAKFNIILEIVDGQTASLYFNRAFLKCIEQLQAEVDIDTYVL